MSEARDPSAAIGAENWKEFLQEFSTRNYNRRARFDVFRSDGKVDEEGQESHLEDIVLKTNGDTKNIEIIRIERSESKADKIRDVVTNVRGVEVQYDTDGSEDALEITDDQNTLVVLRLESKVDGAS